MTCERCGNPLVVGEWPFCPHGFGANSVIGDACDITQENGFRTPQHFTSKAERRRALAEKGLEERVRHVTIPGTDKSPHTTDWSRGTVDLAAATVLVSRPSQATRDEPDPPIPMTHTIRELPAV